MFIREELKQREKDQLELLTRRLQSDLTRLSLEVVSSSTLAGNANGATGGAQALSIEQQLMAKLRDRRSQSPEMRPGDTIIVPLDTERVRALPLWQAVTRIFYNLTLGIYAVRHF